MKCLVSVIIPAKNSDETIRICLESIVGQTYPNLEIIIVDSSSSNGTREIAEELGAKVIMIKVGRSLARNIGAKKATGNLILSLDSDMELNHRVVEECVNKVKGGYDALIIPEVSVGEGFWAECKALEKSCYIGDDSLEASRFFKRQAFEEINGYDEELEAGEDWDFNQRIRKAGYRIGRVKALIEHHEGKLSLSKNIIKKYQYGKTLKNYKEKNPEEAKLQLMLFRPAFIKNWRKLVQHPTHALGMIFMKACEFIVIYLGHLVN